MSKIDYFIEQNERPAKSKRRSSVVEPERERTIADDFGDQIETLYNIPRKARIRDEVRFSPSMVTRCARELYYINTNALTDQQPKVVAWKQRLPRNGEGVHEITQRDYLIMHETMAEAGLPVRFQMLEAEKIGKKTFIVDGVEVTLSGRCDGIVRDLVTSKLYVWEKKTKDKLSNLKKLKEPQAEHKAQVVCYSLLFEIPETIFEIESLQKPKWSDDSSDDIKHFYFQSTPKLEEDLLYHLADIVTAIQNGEVPTPEYDKCTFCAYKDQCEKDGR